MMCGARRSPKEKRTPSYEYSTPSYWPVLRSRDCHVCIPLYYISFLSCLPSSLTWTIGRAGASEGSVVTYMCISFLMKRKSGQCPLLCMCTGRVSLSFLVSLCSSILFHMNRVGRHRIFWPHLCVWRSPGHNDIGPVGARCRTPESRCKERGGSI